MVSRHECHSYSILFKIKLLSCILSSFIYQARKQQISCFVPSYSYSVVNGRSGIQDTQTSFIGCDHGKVDLFPKYLIFL